MEAVSILCGRSSWTVCLTKIKKKPLFYPVSLQIQTVALTLLRLVFDNRW